MSAPAAWGAEPEDPDDAACPTCSDGSCAECVATAAVLDAGAAVICTAAGADYTEVHDPHTRAHYRTIAGEVYARMSDAMLETGLVRPKGDDG